jgi:hypothetical protein
MKQVTIQAPVVNAIDSQVKALANITPTGNTIKLSSAEAELISDAVKSANTTTKKWQKMADDLYANGKRSEHFDRKEAQRIKDNELIRFHESVNGAIVSSYDADAIKLYNADPETLNTSKQVERVVLRSKVSDHFSNVKKAIKNIESRIASGKADGKEPATSNIGMVIKNIQNSIERLEAEKKPYAGIVDHIKGLKMIMNDIKKQA